MFAKQQLEAQKAKYEAQLELQEIAHGTRIAEQKVQMLQFQLEQASEQKAKHEAHSALQESKIKALQHELLQVRREPAAPAADATVMAQIMFHGNQARFHNERRAELRQVFDKERNQAAVADRAAKRDNAARQSEATCVKIEPGVKAPQLAARENAAGAAR
jgi:hypothetical protein